MAHISVQNSAVTLKNTIGRLREVFHFVVLIHEGDIHWQCIQYSCQFLSIKASGKKLHKITIAVARCYSACVNSFGNPFFLWIVKTKSDFDRLTADFVPVLIGQCIECHWEKDFFFFGNHFLSTTGSWSKYNFGYSFEFFFGYIGRLQHFDSTFYKVANFIVLAPHYFWRSGDSLFFEIRKKQIFLALIVFIHIEQTVEQSTQSHYFVGNLRVRRMYNFRNCSKNGVTHIADFFVFLTEYIHRMTGSHRFQCR